MKRNGTLLLPQEMALVAYRIIIDLSDRKLYLLDNYVVVNTFPVGIGRIALQTPSGEFRIVNKVPNPGGPFGVFWMGLSKPHYGIHGTNDPSSIGKMVSHGCIRMYNPDVIRLSRLVSIGTRVTIRP
jgi:lipoprotein-anchoring transpeptidase ErfK/SrfK